MQVSAEVREMREDRAGVRAERREVRPDAGDASPVVPAPGAAVKTTLTLCGGKVIEDYDNRTCLLCGRPLHHVVTCRRAEGLVCQSHCLRCRYYLAAVQWCTYRKKEKSQQ